MASLRYRNQAQSSKKSIFINTSFLAIDEEESKEGSDKPGREESLRVRLVRALKKLMHQKYEDSATAIKVENMVKGFNRQLLEKKDQGACKPSLRNARKSIIETNRHSEIQKQIKINVMKKQEKKEERLRDLKEYAYLIILRFSH